MSDDAHLPAYAATLTAFHRAFRRELRRAVRAVPLPTGASVLDVPCGDGFFTALLARRLHPFGRVTAADQSDAYLAAAAETVAGAGDTTSVAFVKADAYHLPFDDAAFDVVWCAQSFISLDDPVAALEEMRRVTRPGGRVAVLEDDEFHRVVVNWPVELEVEVQRAAADASRARYGSKVALSPARRMRQFILDAGLTPRGKKTFAADRQTPFGPAARRFLRLHLRDSREFLADHLKPAALAALDRAIDPDDPESLLNREDATMTCLTTLFLAGR
ncbi:MAG TPA: methyltransferase domain-containing protein [Urbifossiella sp.]|nr:methyltransferase domain-containing protein [Urbifossiella sp.]